MTPREEKRAWIRNAMLERDCYLAALLEIGKRLARTGGASVWPGESPLLADLRAIRKIVQEATGKEFEEFT